MKNQSTMLRDSKLLFFALLLSAPIMVEAMGNKSENDIAAAAKKNWATYAAAYNECVKSSPCVFESNGYGDNSYDYEKCLKSCERFALAHTKGTKATPPQTLAK